MNVILYFRSYQAFKNKKSMKGIQFLLRGFIVASILLFFVQVWATDFTATITGSDTFVIVSAPLAGNSDCDLIEGTHSYSADGGHCRPDHHVRYIVCQNLRG